MVDTDRIAPRRHKNYQVYAHLGRHNWNINPHTTPHMAFTSSLCRTETVPFSVAQSNFLVGAGGSARL